MAFCLKVKSDYSFLSSTITIDDMISFCKQSRFSYASLIDNNLFGALHFYNACAANNLKPILGLELNVDYKGNNYPLIFIAKSEIGYKNLVKLTSIASKYQSTSIDFKVLSMYAQDVILLISSEDSYLTFLIANNNYFDANEFIDDLKGIYKDIYFGVYRYKGIDDTLLNLMKDYVSSLNIKSVAMQIATHKSSKDTVILNLLDCIKKNIPASKEYLSIPSIANAYLMNEETLKIYYDNEELVNLENMAKSISLKIICPRVVAITKTDTKKKIDGKIQ